MSSRSGTESWTRIACGQRFDPPGGGFPSPRNAIGRPRGHMQCLYHFLDCLDRNVPASPGPAEGIRLQRLLEQIRHSAADGGWMNIEND